MQSRLDISYLLLYNDDGRNHLANYSTETEHTTRPTCKIPKNSTKRGEQYAEMQEHNTTGQCDPVKADRGKHNAGGTLQSNWMQHQVSLVDYERQAQWAEISRCAKQGVGNQC